MFGWGKKAREVEQVTIVNYVKQVQRCFAEINARLIKEFGSMDEVQKSIEANKNNIVVLSQQNSSLSQSLTMLAQAINALVIRIEQLEGHLSLSSVKFEKGKNN